MTKVEYDALLLKAWGEFFNTEKDAFNYINSVGTIKATAEVILNMALYKPALLDDLEYKKIIKTYIYLQDVGDLPFNTIIDGEAEVK